MTFGAFLRGQSQDSYEKNSLRIFHEKIIKSKKNCSLHINSNFTVQTPCLPFFIAIFKLFKFTANFTGILKINNVSTKPHKMLKINSLREFRIFRSKTFPFQGFQIAFALPFPTSDKRNPFSSDEAGRDPRVMEIESIIFYTCYSTFIVLP